MSIMDMFSFTKPAVAPVPAAPTGPSQPGSIPASAPNSGATSTGAAPNGTLPAAGGDLAAPAATPLDAFKDIWNTEPADPANPKPDGSVFGNVDPKKFMEAAGKIDFSKAVTPEQLQAIAAGGEGAVAAFAAALNKTAQGVYAQSAYATTKIVEQALAKSKDSFLTELPQHIKRQQVSSNLHEANPIFSNPAVKPIISALEAQMTVKYPQATATEITTMAQNYVAALGTSFTPAPVPKPGEKKDEGTDWSKFLEG